MLLSLSSNNFIPLWLSPQPSSCLPLLSFSWFDYFISLSHFQTTSSIWKLSSLTSAPTPDPQLQMAYSILWPALLILLEPWASVSFALLNAMWPPSQAISASLDLFFWFPIGFLHMLTFDLCENADAFLPQQPANSCVVTECCCVYVIHTCEAWIRWRGGGSAIWSM